MPEDYGMHGREYPINPETPDKPSDPIMDDIVRLSAASSAFATYQYAIKDVLGVLMTETAQFIIIEPEHITPIDLDAAASPNQGRRAM